MKKKMKTN